MAAEVETTGIVVKTFESFCVVSINIDGCTKLFSVSKTLFYTYGLKCDGDLTNLVEEDTEIDLCYRFGPGSAPTVLAVWIGEKPDVSEDVDRLMPVYDKKGVLIDSVIDTNFGRVLVNKGVIYRDGQLERGLFLDEEISFDAVPLRDANFSGAVYEATCAWIGSKPRIVDRFHLENDETQHVEFDHDVSGVVMVIPCDVLAFVDVEVESALVKVILFRSSFKHNCDRIQDVVNVGDEICMRLGYAFVFPGRKQWFAVSAIRTSYEFQADELCAFESLDADEFFDADEVGETDGVGGNDAVCESDDAIQKEESIEIPNEPIKVVNKYVKNNIVMTPVETEENVRSAKSTEQCGKDSTILFSDPPLVGIVSQFSSDGCIITYGQLEIFLDPSNFYIEGKDKTYDDFQDLASVGCNTVYFEAVLVNGKDEKYSEFTHVATCAWVGKKPTLEIIAASLPPPNSKLMEASNRRFYGKVVKLCFPSVAFLVIDDESTVSLHVNAFVTKPHYPSKGVHRNFISSYVRLDDWVLFKVKRTPIVPKFVSAFKAGPVFSPKEWAKISSGTAALLASHKLRKSETPPSCSSPSCKPTSSNVEASTASSEPAVCIASPFKNGRFLQDRVYMMNCRGTLKSRYDELMKKHFVTVEHVFGSTKVNNNTVYVSDDKVVSIERMPEWSGRLVRFDAQTTMSSNGNPGFTVTRMWNNGDARPASEVVLFSDLKLFEGIYDEGTRCCLAKITSIPLPDTAIASIKGVPILVPFDSLVTVQEFNKTWSSMDTVLSVGDFVGLKFEKQKFPGEIIGSYFRAVNCWSLSKGGEEITLDDEIRVADPRINSWFSIWGFGQFFCKGIVKAVNGRYFVDITTKHYSLSLDIFEKGKVCVKGKLVEIGEFNAYSGSKITFHVGHEYVEKLSETISSKMFESKRFFVACSWIGDEPAPELCMRDALAVPKGIVCSNRFYEVIVQSFPTPTHAICLLGYVPVLVPLPQITQNGNFIGVADVNLRKGARIVVNVLEKEIENTTVLVSNSLNFRRVEDIVYQDVLKNVSGKIETLPNPTGFIKAFNGDFTVSFELCNVRRYKKSPGSDRKWLESLKNILSIGKKVYFSAVKTNNKTAPYRALEVY